MIHEAQLLQAIAGWFYKAIIRFKKIIWAAPKIFFALAQRPKWHWRHCRPERQCGFAHQRHCTRV